MAQDPLQRALLEPAWKGNASPGEEGGRPDIGALVAALLPGGAPFNGEGSSVRSLARI